ncbi:MAG TPA: hypothetical protein DC053_03790 [Lachnoclostridium sp.]|nr:hypothetical protein [Lachnoclostridium sp.]
MSINDIKQMLDETGIKYNYHHFETEEAIAPPFLVWILPGTQNFMADGITYQGISELDIELYTDKKDFNLEKSIEEVLKRYGLPWNKTEQYIESENMYEVLYEMEVLISGE